MERITDKELLRSLEKYQCEHYQKQVHSVWHRLPVSRRSAVFVLLFLGNLGELRVVLTKRSSKLRHFPGHISLPGGKADTGLESEWQVSRREMFEEIGLESDNAVLMQKYGFEIQHLNILPCYLSRTFSGVRPCVGFMKSGETLDEQNLIKNLKISLNPGESSGIFSCPLRDFLYPNTNEKPLECIDRMSHKVKWGGIPWSLRSYSFPQFNPHEAPWLKDIADLSASEESSEEETTMKHATSSSGVAGEPKTKKAKKDLSTWGRLGSRRLSDSDMKIYDVWGLTANIIHDVADIVYGNQSTSVHGEEELIYSVFEHGKQMRQKERSEEEIKLINSRTSDDFGFNSILPRAEFVRLKRIYKL